MRGCLRVDVRDRALAYRVRVFLFVCASVFIIVYLCIHVRHVYLCAYFFLCVHVCVRICA